MVRDGETSDKTEELVWCGAGLVWYWYGAGVVWCWCGAGLVWMEFWQITHYLKLFTSRVNRETTKNRSRHTTFREEMEFSPCGTLFATAVSAGNLFKRIKFNNKKWIRIAHKKSKFHWK